MTSEKLPKPHVLLRHAYQRKKTASKRYSQGILARELGVSTAFVANVLTGKKAIPLNRIDVIAKKLEMDTTERDRLRRSVIYHSIKSPELKSVLRDETSSVNAKIDQFNKTAPQQISVLKHWFNVALRDLIACSNFVPDPKIIGRRLGITAKQAKESLETLKAAGLANEQNGEWTKSEAFALFPTTKSVELVRAFHRQMLKKANEQLSLNDRSAFEKRLITGFTIAANPDHVEKLKSMIFKFLGSASAALAEGDCREVYQLNVQLFPLSKEVS